MTPHQVFWDGECPMCARSAHWAERRQKDGALRLIPYQEVPNPPMTPDLYQACGQAIHVLTRDGRLLRAGRAAMFVLEHLGFRRLARALSQQPFIWFVEIGYWLVARNRSRIGRFILPHEPREPSQEHA